MPRPICALTPQNLTQAIQLGRVSGYTLYWLWQAAHLRTHPRARSLSGEALYRYTAQQRPPLGELITEVLTFHHQRGYSQKELNEARAL